MGNYRQTTFTIRWQDLINTDEDDLYEMVINNHYKDNPFDRDKVISNIRLDVVGPGSSIEDSHTERKIVFRGKFNLRDSSNENNEPLFTREEIENAKD